MVTKRSTVALALGGTLVLTACNAGSGTDDEADATSGGGEAAEAVTIGLVAEPASLDFTTTDGAAIPQAMLYNVYETLVKLDQDGQIVPALASEWEVSEDNTTYTFTLVEDATFTDGDPFTADDAVFSIERVQSDAWTTSLAAQMDIVESVEATGEHELDGHPGPAEQLLALCHDQPDRRDVRRERRRRPRQQPRRHRSLHLRGVAARHLPDARAPTPTTTATHRSSTR